MADADVLQSLAEVAARHDWTAPVINTGALLQIASGRHPVVERILGRDGFVPNDCLLADGTTAADGPRCVILTGPNMAGKSTYIRQVALQVLLAQLGGFVPATQAVIGVVDRVFARVGSADDLSHGASTFMVEMTESANILNSATERSLVILDEIGRGTSTFDGVSIAWAMAEHLHDTVKARTLFATHYHEMTALAESRPGVANRHVAVADDGDRVVFLHQIREGTSDRSYGVHVAQLAGVPPEVVTRATELLQQLESGDAADGSTAMRATLAGRSRGRGAHPDQLDMFQAPEPAPPAAPADPDPVRQAIAALDVENLTPIQAMQKLAELRDQARRDG
jgi:DNA mismatch repair protein MutS